MKQQLAQEYLLAPSSAVLLIDDDDDDLRYHREVLENQGHRVSPCSSYSQGADLAARDTYDIVIVGEGGPAFPGREVIERLREHGLTAPVLVLTRSMDMPRYLEAMDLGAVDYVEKPVHPSEMRRLMREHLQTALASG